MQASHKVAFNTFILYTRVVITGGITLYTTRLVLEALGVEDYGIYSLIAGVVAMLVFLNAALTVSTQRYLSYYEGKNDPVKQKSIFAGSLMLHILAAMLIVVGMEIAGLFLFDGFLNIPGGRLEDARIAYRMMEAMVFFAILSVPFTATVNAHEDMLLLAVVNIVEVVLRLILVALLFCLKQDERLVFYSVANAVVSLAAFLLYVIICKLRYKECTLQIHRYARREEVNELKSFTGWNLFDSLCNVARSQGISVVLNIFCGVVVNAAYAIAGQLGAYFTFFSSSILQTMNPQIMKSEGNDNRKRMLRLSMTTSKLAFFLFAAIAIPGIFEMKGLLGWWLKEIPSQSEIFCILVLICTLVNLLTIGLQSAIQATGRIKVYQATVSSLLLMILPVAIVLLWLGFPSYSVLIGSILIESVACCLRLYFLKKIAGLSLREYACRVFGKEFFPLLILVSVCLLTTISISWQWRFVITFFLSGIFFLPGVYFTGLCPDEKTVVKDLVGKAVVKLKNNRR